MRSEFAISIMRLPLPFLITMVLTVQPAFTADDESNPAASWLNLPVRTWISRPFPPHQSDVRKQVIGQRGYGPSPFGGGAKHQRLVYNPDNNRIYFYSGDFSGPPFQSSFRTDLFSYDITRSNLSDAGDYQNWILEWPYCGLADQISPVSTDEAPFVWDSKRRLFWIIGGFEHSTQDVVRTCNSRALFYGLSGGKIANHPPDILHFDPVQRRFIRPDARYKLPGDAVAQDRKSSVLGGAQTPRHAVYNPATDEIIMMGRHGGWGNFVARMNCETGAWYQDVLAHDISRDAIDGVAINDTDATHEQLALDAEHQWIYWIDTFHKSSGRFRLMRYDIGRHRMVSLGRIPLPSFGDGRRFPYYAGPYDSTMLVYDSINRVVLWPASSNAGRPILMIYHPDPKGGKNGNWEVDPMKRDKANETIFGSNGTFIPELNAMVIYGGFGSNAGEAELPAPMKYFWLYRYGNGTGHSVKAS